MTIKKTLALATILMVSACGYAQIPVTPPGGGGGGGGLTSFTTSNLSPLFTVDLGANPTTAPAQAFTLSSTSQNFVFAGPTSGSGLPSYRLLVAGDIPSLLSSYDASGAASAVQTNLTAEAVLARNANNLTSGTVAAARMPAFTGGDFSTSSGSVAGTVTGINGAAVPASAAVLATNSLSQTVTATTTGTGSVVLATSPTLVTPVLGAATGTSISLTGNYTTAIGQGYCVSTDACLFRTATAGQMEVGNATSPNGNGTFLAANLIGNTSVTGATFATKTNCASSASPAVCTSAASGSVVIAASATTVVVNTTAVTPGSQIQLTWDSSLGTRLGVTCNAAPTQLVVTARTNLTSFTISTIAPTVNPACISYTIFN
jgi:hypothetical protein